MRKIVFFATVGFAGMDETNAQAYPDDVTTKTLDEHAWQYAVSNAEMYGYYNIHEYDVEISDEDDEEGDKYVDSIEGWWEDYVPEKHDGLATSSAGWDWKL